MLGLLQYLFDVGAVVAWVQGVLDQYWPTAADYGVHGVLICEGVFGVMALLLLVAIAMPLERIRPIERHDNDEARAEIRMEWMLVAAMTVIQVFTGILAVGLTTWIVGILGTGRLVAIDPQSILGVMALTLAYAFYIDLFKYWVHRLEHMVPALWAIHSFHHSAERITVITGARHHWLEGLTIVPMVVAFEMIFEVPQNTVVMALLLLKVPDGLQHLNYKIAWHRVGILFNTPQWHRIHHSIEEKHWEKNFSSSLPIMDVIFGTAYYPAPDEYPATGLVPSDSPRLWQGIIWPFRGLIARLPRRRSRIHTIRAISQGTPLGYDAVTPPSISPKEGPHATLSTSEQRRAVLHLASPASREHATTYCQGPGPASLDGLPRTQTKYLCPLPYVYVLLGAANRASAESLCQSSKVSKTDR